MEYRLDPRVKQTIRDKLREGLYAGVERRYNEDLNTIIDRNCLLMGYKEESFTFRNTPHHKVGARTYMPGQRLHPDLHAAMDKLLADRKKIKDEEEPYIMGFFTKALNKSSSIQDFFLMFPDYLHDSLNMFATQEWRESSSWCPRELSDEQIEAFKEEHEPWLEKLRNRLMIDLLLN